MTVLIDKTVKLSERPEVARANALSERFTGTEATEILKVAITDYFPDQIALSSSFGADSVVLLHMVSQIDPGLPIIFLDTDRHFFQTLQSRDELVERLGLKNLIILRPNTQEVADFDASSNLSQLSVEACCALRKVRPMRGVLQLYGAWITGRKRFQSASRANLKAIEWDGSHFKINPLVDWSADAVSAYLKAHDLPEHPLMAQGYSSIGCYPCTRPVAADEDARAGRWAGQDKVECGIHRPMIDGDGI